MVVIIDIGIVNGWDWYRWWLRMILSMVVSISSIVDIDNRWWLRLWLLILSIVDIGIVNIVDGRDYWYWYRRWLRLISWMVEIVDIGIVDGCDWYRRCWEWYCRWWYRYRQLLILIIVDGWDCGYRYCQLLILVSSISIVDIDNRRWLRLWLSISSIVTSISWMVEIIDIGIVDGWDWYRRWLRLWLSILSIVDIGIVNIVDGQDYWYWYRWYCNMVILVIWLRLLLIAISKLFIFWSWFKWIWSGDTVFSRVISHTQKKGTVSTNGRLVPRFSLSYLAHKNHKKNFNTVKFVFWSTQTLLLKKSQGKYIRKRGIAIILIILI